MLGNIFLRKKNHTLKKFSTQAFAPEEVVNLKKMSKTPEEKPGDGIRSMRSTTAFRVVNFELYAKPNIVIMSIGLTCFGIALGYLAYMRTKYESMGYYAAVDKDGKEIFEKKKSKWD